MAFKATKTLSGRVFVPLLYYIWKIIMILLVEISAWSEFNGQQPNPKGLSAKWDSVLWEYMAGGVGIGRN